MKFEAELRVCPSLVNVGMDEEPSMCPYAPNCRYIHNVEEYMKERKPDIIPGGCYNYQTTGRCSRGISCLFGDEHVTKEGKNLQNPNPTCPSSKYFNFLSKDLQLSLRKKKYSFDKAESIVKEINSNKNKAPTAKKEVLKKVNQVVEAISEVVKEPSAKKICLEKTGPITNEDTISLKHEEKKKAFRLIESK